MTNTISLTPEQAKQYIGTKTLMKFWDDDPEDSCIGFLIDLMQEPFFTTGIEFEYSPNLREHTATNTYFKNCAIYKPPHSHWRDVADVAIKAKDNALKERDELRKEILEISNAAKHTFNTLDNYWRFIEDDKFSCPCEECKNKVPDIDSCELNLWEEFEESRSHLLEITNND